MTEDIQDSSWSRKDTEAVERLAARRVLIASRIEFLENVYKGQKKILDEEMRRVTEDAAYLFDKRCRIDNTVSSLATRYGTFFTKTTPKSLVRDPSALYTAIATTPELKGYTTIKTVAISPNALSELKQLKGEDYNIPGVEFTEDQSFQFRRKSASV